MSDISSLKPTNVSYFAFQNRTFVTGDIVVVDLDTTSKSVVFSRIRDGILYEDGDGRLCDSNGVYIVASMPDICTTQFTLLPNASGKKILSQIKQRIQATKNINNFENGLKFLSFTISLI